MRGGDDDVPAAPIVRPPGSGSGGGRAGMQETFDPPASFTKNVNGKGTYMERGDDVQATLKNARGLDSNNIAVSEYPEAIANTGKKGYTIDVTDVEKIGEILPTLKQPLADMNVDPTTDFRYARISAGQQSNGAAVSETYHSSAKRTAICSSCDNNYYGPDFEGVKAKQSQMLFSQWQAEAGSNVKSLQYVARSFILNDDTRAIIEDTFGGLKQSKGEFSATAAEGTRERAVFDALSGTDNGRMVFLMLADNSVAMGGKSVNSVHAYIEDDNHSMNLLWELTP